MKRLFSVVLLTLPLALAPSIGLAAPSSPFSVGGPLSVGGPFSMGGSAASEPSSPIGDFFEDLVDVNRAYVELLRAFASRNPEEIAEARAELQAAIADLFGQNGVGTPAI
jgi:hypothetical protein